MSDSEATIAVGPKVTHKGEKITYIHPTMALCAENLEEGSYAFSSNITAKGEPETKITFNGGIQGNTMDSPSGRIEIVLANNHLMVLEGGYQKGVKQPDQLAYLFANPNDSTYVDDINSGRKDDIDSLMKIREHIEPLLRGPFEVKLPDADLVIHEEDPNKYLMKFNVPKCGTTMKDKDGKTVTQGGFNLTSFLGRPGKIKISFNSVYYMENDKKAGGWLAGCKPELLLEKYCTPAQIKAEAQLKAKVESQIDDKKKQRAKIIPAKGSRPLKKANWNLKGGALVDAPKEESSDAMEETPASA